MNKSTSDPKKVFIVILLLQILLNRSNISTCVSAYGKLVVVLHHAVQLYIIFGSLLFGLHKFHLLVIVIAFVVHKAYGMCPITIYHNKKCKYKNTESPLKTFLNDLSPFLNISPITLYYFVLGLLSIYDVYMINKI
jgi:hypothetical protein